MEAIQICHNRRKVQDKSSERSVVCPMFKCRRYWQEKRRNKKQWSEVVFFMMPCQAKSLQKILQLLEHSSLQMTQPEKQKILIQ